MNFFLYYLKKNKVKFYYRGKKREENHKLLQQMVDILHFLLIYFLIDNDGHKKYLQFKKNVS